VNKRQDFVKAETDAEIRSVEVRQADAAARKRVRSVDDAAPSARAVPAASPRGGKADPIEKTTLTAIICPLTPRELPAALSNMAYWDKMMPPLLELREPAGARPKLIFSFNGEPDANLSGPLMAQFERSPAVKGSFETIEVRFCRLPPEKDVYLREGEVGDAPFGRKAGPNWLFYETMRALRHEARFVFLMETDCQPVAPNWIKRIERACMMNQDAWIVGSHYCGASPLHWSIARHINGNALYNLGDPLFWEFLENRFWPWLNDYAVATMPDLAYDCAWETYLNRMEMEDAGSYDWVRVRDILQRFRLANFVVNVGGTAEQSGEYLFTREDIIKRFPGVAIVHGPLAASVDHKRGPLGLGHPVLKGGVTADAEVLRAEGDLAKAVFRRSLWISGQPLEETDTLTVLFTLHCIKAASVTVALREPSGRLLGSTTLSGAGYGNARRGKFVQAITRPLPYVRLVFHFHGPAESDVKVTDVRCDVHRGDALFWRTNRVLGN
jgi:hypothetical protein